MGLASDAPQAHFVTGTKNDVLLETILRNADPNPNFNRHYSMSFSNCGTGCFNFWFIDRRNGDVIGVPNERAGAQIIWGSKANISSDVMVVTYGPMDGVGKTCETQ